MNRMNWLILVSLTFALSLALSLAFSPASPESIAHIKDRVHGDPGLYGEVLPGSRVAHIKDFAPPPAPRLAHIKDRAGSGLTRLAHIKDREAGGRRLG